MKRGEDMSRKTSMIAIAATVCALGATGLGIAAFPQQAQAPLMPADLARMAEAAHARLAEATAQQTQAASMPADLARMAETAHARMAEAAQSPENVRSRELPEYTAAGELILPKNWREWVYVGSP
jgi:hypothetical protein